MLLWHVSKLRRSGAVTHLHLTEDARSARRPCAAPPSSSSLLPSSSPSPSSSEPRELNLEVSPRHEFHGGGNGTRGSQCGNMRGTHHALRGWRWSLRGSRHARFVCQRAATRAVKMPSEAQVTLRLESRLCRLVGRRLCRLVGRTVTRSVSSGRFLQGSIPAKSGARFRSGDLGSLQKAVLAFGASLARSWRLLLLLLLAVHL